jgi:hypothetical protein
MTGRNAPCPCGSGLKYKKCCGNLTQAMTTEFSPFLAVCIFVIAMLYASIGHGGTRVTWP